MSAHVYRRFGSNFTFATDNFHFFDLHQPRYM